MRDGASLAHFANDAGICFSYALSGIRDFRMITPSGRRSTAMSRGSHSILRKAGLVSTAAALPLIIASPGILVLCGSLSAPDIDRLSLFEEGPDERIYQRRIERVEAVRAIERHPVDAVLVFDQQRLSHEVLLHQQSAMPIAAPSPLVGEGISGASPAFDAVRGCQPHPASLRE